MHTIDSLIRRAASMNGPLNAFADAYGAVTYTEFEGLVASARGFLSQVGVQQGDRVGVISANSVDFTIVDHACLTAGFVRVGMNRRSAPVEVAKLAAAADISVLFVDGEWAAKITPELLPENILIVNLDSDETAPIFRERLREIEPAPAAENLGGADEAAYIFTSGTTGAPKTIIVTQANLAATVRNVLIEIPTQLGMKALHPIPLTHAAFQLSLAFFCRGVEQRFTRTTNPDELLDQLAGEGIEICSSVPTLLAMKAKCQLERPRDLSRLKAIVYGGTRISPKDMEAAVHAFGETLYQVFAQSEGSLPTTCLGPRDHVRAVNGETDLLGSAGRPGPYLEIAILDPEGNEVAPGSPGEIALRGDVVTPGYKGEPEVTAATIDGRGWLHTGDVGRMNSLGYLEIIDRLKDMIISGGFNVFPTEVEDALRGLPGITDVAVYGVPDEKWGEKICVAVVGEAVTLEILQDFARKSISGYKVPREVRHLNALPVNATGKVLRRVLREEHGA